MQMIPIRSAWEWEIGSGEEPVIGGTSGFADPPLRHKAEVSCFSPHSVVPRQRRPRHVSGNSYRGFFPRQLPTFSHPRSLVDAGIVWTLVL